jgi:hypothetical protein
MLTKDMINQYGGFEVVKADGDQIDGFGVGELDLAKKCAEQYVRDNGYETVFIIERKPKVILTCDSKVKFVRVKE